MPRRSTPPKYSKHSSGQARVRINGEVIYLGPYGSPESREKYAQLITRWLRENQVTHRNCPFLTNGKLAVVYLEHCRGYYRKNGRETTEVQNVRDARISPSGAGDTIFNSTPIEITDNYRLYTRRGTVNGYEGTYEIGVRPSTSGRVELITHRFFRPD